MIEEERDWGGGGGKQRVREGKRDRETDSQIDRQTDKQADKIRRDGHGQTGTEVERENERRKG